MHYTAFTMTAGDRLGIAVSVENQETDADAIQLLYEHHIFPTRLEVDTNTPLG